jgi:hypothetical protein
MIFKDWTIVAGRVSSRQTVDSRELEAWAVEHCGVMLRRLRGGTPEAHHHIDGMPPFTARLGLPPEIPRAPGADLFFCVGAPGEDPFQYNLLIRQTTDREQALWAMSTLFGVSFAVLGPRGMTAEEMEEMLPPLYEERPILLSTVLPVASAEPRAIFIAADFAKCMAAAMLLDSP